MTAPGTYVNTPYAPGGHEVRPTPTQAILAAYAENVAIVNGDAATIENAVALCWLLHLVGDVHQSLHTEAFLHECSAELVRRLETAGVRFAA